MSVLLPYVLEYNLEKRGAIIGELLLPLAGDEAYARTPAVDRPRAAITRLRSLRDALWEKAKLPRTLAETGKVAKNQLEEIARLSLDDGALLMNPAEVHYADALQVLTRAYGG
jgi:alcohol dehydrogenase